jgi:ATP-binding cassette, subfamily B, bacterial
MTLGMMLAVQYIIGQLNSPVEQLIGFFNTTQDARISLERLGEIHDRHDEEDPILERLQEIPPDQELKLRNLSFRYEGPESELVLNNISMSIPPGKHYSHCRYLRKRQDDSDKTAARILSSLQRRNNLGKSKFELFSLRQWRRECGVVMQDGYPVLRHHSQ